jgi:8-oxo-dGTP diphosphatase
VPVTEIPYEQMWADDAEWLPKVIDGQYVEARFIFEDDRMLSKNIIERK